MFVAQDKNFLDTSHVSNEMVSYSLNFIFNFFFIRNRGHQEFEWSNR